MKWIFLIIGLMILAGGRVSAETAPLCSIENNPGWSAPGYILKDHCLYKKNGVWHVIGIKSKEGSSYDEPGNEATFMHGVSTDLINWTLEPDVISTVPESFESDHVWAPSAVERDGTVYLFYTMVRLEDGQNRQRIGYATSRNLQDWEQQSSFEPLWDPAVFASWSGWAPPYGGACRDPMVFYDEPNSRYIMYYTALHSTWRCAIGAAVSTDLVTWTDAGYVFMADSGGTWGTAQLESPYVFIRNGHYYLFYNHGAPEPPDGTGNGIHWVMSDDPLNFGEVPAGVTDPNPLFLKKVSFELVYGDDAPYSEGEWLFTVCWNLRLGRIDWQGDVPVVTGVDLGAIAAAESTYNSAHTNQPPSVDAGSDQNVNLSKTLLLNGIIDDPDDTPSVVWVVSDAPVGGIVTFDDPNAATTSATFTQPGVYVLSLTADDGINDPVSDTIQITVLDDSLHPSRTELGCMCDARGKDLSLITLFVQMGLTGFGILRMKFRLS